MTNSAPSKAIYFEKTVEWLYVKKYLNFGAPLDGGLEIAGDAILFDKGKFLAVEFKKEFDNIKSERKKYVCLKHSPNEFKRKQKSLKEANEEEKKNIKAYLLTAPKPKFAHLSSTYLENLIEKEKLFRDDNCKALSPHFLIYGETFEDDGTTKLKCVATNYWGKWVNEREILSPPAGTLIEDTAFRSLEAKPSSMLIDDFNITEPEMEKLTSTYGYCAKNFNQYLSALETAKTGVISDKYEDWKYGGVLGILDDKLHCIMSIAQFQKKYLKYKKNFALKTSTSLKEPS